MLTVLFVALEFKQIAPFVPTKAAAECRIKCIVIHALSLD